MITGIQAERGDLREHFLSKSEWANAQRIALAGDASRRRYHRLKDTETGQGAILMDAPPELGEDVRPFLQVAAYLKSLGLSAPEIFEADEERGFLILEDFGDTLYDEMCRRQPDSEDQIYDAAVDVLVTLCDAEPMPQLDDYTEMMSRVALDSYRWYVEPLTGRDMSEERAAATEALTPLIALLGGGSVTILRDYHAQNLLWLPDREGAARVGLLDFQDAMHGPAAYDLISLTTDARRDVPAHIQTRCKDRFVERRGLNAENFAREAAICSVQRNLRILMVFGRMSLHFEKPHYVDLVPRVWGHLMQDLKHPDLSDLAALVHTHFPEPTPENLKLLKEKCGTIPTL
ncbi:aminoglycoside phosphotransferase family protein [Celeribacter litoreus]|uniref:aminoglycoside phosphotransferase family protein n=1 Tax=Celeribacter litoreus TaxID=2876714 RepID=UPI001CCF1AFD|nr:phosphotransferase [Celeribacter litoreus]MCA0042162.1 phosphotransferase [Celeribacter litoreus]